MYIFVIFHEQKPKNVLQKHWIYDNACQILKVFVVDASFFWKTILYDLNSITLRNFDFISLLFDAEIIKKNLARTARTKCATEDIS